MATIGIVNISLGLASAVFSAGIKKARSEFKGFTDFVGSTKGMIAGALGAVGVGMGVNAIKDMVGNQMEAVDAAWKLSSALKMSTENLMGFGLVAKKEANIEDFNSELTKMAANLGQAATEGGPVADALGKLGLSATDLANGKMDDAFLSIAQKISEIKNPAEQAAAAVDIFGKNGKAMLPMFAEGAAGIRQGVAAAVEMGAAVKDFDAAQIVAAKDKFEELGMKIDGIKNQFVIALAPALLEMGDQLLALIPPAEQMRAVFIGGLKAVAYGVAFVIDIWYAFKTAALAVGVAIYGSLYGIAWFIEQLGKGVVWLINKISGTKIEMPDISSGLKGLMDEAARMTGESFNKTGQATVGVEKFFDSIEAKSAATAQALLQKKNDPAAAITESFQKNKQKIEEILNGLKDEIATFGMDAGDKKLFELGKLGATKEQLEQAKKDVAELKRLEDQKKKMDEGKQLTESMLNPIEKYDAEIEKLDGLLEANAIDVETYYRAVGKAQDDLRGGLGWKSELQKAGLQEQRFSYTYKADREVKDPLQDLGRQQVELQKRIAISNEKAAQTQEAIRESLKVGEL
jgi:hypothetical protein